MPVGSASLDGIVDGGGRTAVSVLSTSFTRNRDQLRGTVSSIHGVGGSTAIESIDCCRGGGEPAEEVSGTSSINVGSTLHRLKGESGDEWSG